MPKKHRGITLTEEQMLQIRLDTDRRINETINRLKTKNDLMESLANQRQHIDHLNEVIQTQKEEIADLKPLAEKGLAIRAGARKREDDLFLTRADIYYWVSDYIKSHPRFVKGRMVNTNRKIEAAFRKKFKKPFPRKALEHYCKEEGYENPMRVHKHK